MAIDFSKFDNKVDLDALQKEVDEAKETDFEDVPDGTYVVAIEKMEIKLTKAQDKLMFAAQFKIKEGEYANRMIFFNRVISGNTSPKWTDAQAIKSVITWLDKLETEIEPNLLTMRIFLIVSLIFFRKYRMPLKWKLHIKVMRLTRSQSMKFLTCNLSEVIQAVVRVKPDCRISKGRGE